MEEQALSFEEELERKTLEALSRVVSDYEQGAISQPAAKFALQTIFTATSGLAGDEVFNLISAASTQINSEPKRDMVRRFFVHPTKQEMVLLVYQFGEAEITIKRGSYPRKASEVNVWTRISTATFEVEANPFEAAQLRFSGYAESLLRNGFQEIQ